MNVARTERKHRTGRVRAALVSVLVAGAVLTVAPPVQATTDRGAGPNASAARPAYVYTCSVAVNGTRYRTGPGTEYTALGTVNQGQKMDVFHAHQNPVDGWWVQGDLWGGARGVWIRRTHCY